MVLRVASPSFFFFSSCVTTFAWVLRIQPVTGFTTALRIVPAPSSVSAAVAAAAAAAYDGCSTWVQLWADNAEWAEVERKKHGLSERMDNVGELPGLLLCGDCPVTWTNKEREREREKTASTTKEAYLSWSPYTSVEDPV